MKLSVVSLSGTIELIEDQAVVQRDIVNLTQRYIKDPVIREQYITTFLKQPRVALHLRGEKGTESFM